MLRRDPRTWTPEEFDAAVRKMVKAEVMYGMFVARGDDAPWDEYRVASHQADVAVIALFKTEEERHTAIRIVNGETEVVEGVSEAAADAFLARPLPTPPAGSEEVDWRERAENATEIASALLSMEDMVRVDRNALVRLARTARSLRAEVEQLTRCVKLDGALIDAAGRELNKAYVVRDRLRLDWLSKQLQGRLDDDPEGEATIGDVDLRGSWNSVGLTVPNRVNVHGSDLRDAIDAARTAGEGRDG